MTTLPDEPAQTRQRAEAPAENPPASRPPGLRRLLAGMVLTNFLLCVLWAAIGTTVLALQVQRIDPATYVGSLGLILSIGAIGSMISGPVMGTVSDRMRTRLGGRVPVMLGGAVLTLVLAVLMGTATTIGALVAYWFLMQFVTVGCISTTLYAHLPDRVPVARRGMFSSSLGVAALLGATVGQAVGSALATMLFVAYLVIALALVVGVGVLARVAARSNVGLPKNPLDVKAVLRTFWVSPRKHPDFAWTFAARFLLYSGYFLLSSYTLYMLQDYVGLGVGGAVRVVPLVGVATLVGVLVSTPVAGWLVDRFGRTKPILVIVSATLAAGSLVPLAVPTVGGLITYAVLSGFGFGAYLSVDFVLITQVLPSASDAAKDLGIINITATLPQTVAAGGAGLVITLLGYPALFPIAAVFALLGGLLLLPVRSVR